MTCDMNPLRSQQPQRSSESNGKLVGLMVLIGRCWFKKAAFQNDGKSTAGLVAAWHVAPWSSAKSLAACDLRIGGWPLERSNFGKSPGYRTSHLPSRNRGGCAHLLGEATFTLKRKIELSTTIIMLGPSLGSFW